MIILDDKALSSLTLTYFIECDIRLDCIGSIIEEFIHLLYRICHVSKIIEFPNLLNKKNVMRKFCIVYEGTSGF